MLIEIEESLVSFYAGEDEIKTIIRELAQAFPLFVAFWNFEVSFEM